MEKIKKLGICGKLGTWLGKFMMGHSQAVKVGDQISDWEEVLSGIPQGSVLGPLLFLLMISDLGEDVGPEQAKVLKYVDDSKGMKAVANQEDVQEFQAVINKFTEWQKKNNMRFNSSKFQLMRLGPNCTLKNSTTLFTEDMVSPLVPIDKVKDLGIIVDSGANFKLQRLEATSKALKKALWVLRTFDTRSPGVMVTLWKSLVQPQFDYCSQIWSPVDLPGPLQSMEQPLRAFTRKVWGCSQLSYWERLAKLKLSSIQWWFERYKIFMSGRF